MNALPLRSHFLKKMILIALPIALQNVLYSSRGLIDVIMLGHLGDIELAAIGVAARAIFVTTIMIVGTTTAGALITAQYWGAKNEKGVRENTALTWVISSILGLICASIFLLFSTQIMSFVTEDNSVVDLGKWYLSIAAPSMLSVAFITTMLFSLRAMHKPGVSTFFSAVGLGIYIFLNWVFIFGRLGFPELGFKGAAIATLLSGIAEFLLLYMFIYSKKYTVAFSYQDIVNCFEVKKLANFIKISAPTTLNFLVWAAGLFACHAIMGQTGVLGLVALSVVAPIESFALSVVIGLSSAAGVLIGNNLGAKKYKSSWIYAKSAMVLNISCATIVALMVYLSQNMLLSMFPALTEESFELSKNFIFVLCLGIVLRSIPMMAITGILRAGGDVRFCLYQDIIAQWLITIPISALAVYYLNIGPLSVFLLFLLGELIKCMSSLLRIRGKKWVRGITQS
jgi:putative MATE family efflux protein